MDGKHEKLDDGDEYKSNGHEPDQSIPSEDPGGKHAKQEEEEEEQEQE